MYLCKKKLRFHSTVILRVTALWETGAKPCKVVKKPRINSLPPYSRFELIAFFPSISFPKFQHSSKPWEIHAHPATIKKPCLITVLLQCLWGFIFGVNLHGLSMGLGVQRKVFGLILLSFFVIDLLSFCRYPQKHTTKQMTCAHKIPCQQNINKMLLTYKYIYIHIYTLRVSFVFHFYRFTVNAPHPVRKDTCLAKFKRRMFFSTFSYAACASHSICCNTCLKNDKKQIKQM
jgi:hypothetical protein